MQRESPGGRADELGENVHPSADPPAVTAGPMEGTDAGGLAARPTPDAEPPSVHRGTTASTRASNGQGLILTISEVVITVMAPHTGCGLDLDCGALLTGTGREQPTVRACPSRVRIPLRPLALTGAFWAKARVRRGAAGAAAASLGPPRCDPARSAPVHIVLPRAAPAVSATVWPDLRERDPGESNVARLGLHRCVSGASPKEVPSGRECHEHAGVLEESGLKYSFHTQPRRPSPLSK